MLLWAIRSFQCSAQHASRNASPTLATLHRPADVAELADAPGLGPGTFECGGSTPPVRTIMAFLTVAQLSTPTIVVDIDGLNRNIDIMGNARPGDALRPHLKAHQCSQLAHYAATRSGSRRLCAATLKEVCGAIASGLGEDILLANETLDLGRLKQTVRLAASHDAQLTVAVDSAATIEVARQAAKAGPLAVMIDVNVGLPRCGAALDLVEPLAELAARGGLRVRGVMGYEGHVVGATEREVRQRGVDESMRQLRSAWEIVGGVSSAGGTGTFDLHDWVEEVQAGSYLLMDTHYANLDLPFQQAAWVLGTVIHSSEWGVADIGLKSFGMDHGNPTLEGHDLFFLSDEHLTFIPRKPIEIGPRITAVPAHIDPTMNCHESVAVIERHPEMIGQSRVLECWPIDLRGCDLPL